MDILLVDYLCLVCCCKWELWFILSHAFWICAFREHSLAVFVDWSFYLCPCLIDIRLINYWICFEDIIIFCYSFADHFNNKLSFQLTLLVAAVGHCCKILNRGYLFLMLNNYCTVLLRIIYTMALSLHSKLLAFGCH